MGSAAAGGAALASAGGVAAGAPHTEQAGKARSASVMDTVPKISGEHTFTQDLQNTNPNYSSGNLSWTNNCQRCVSAYEARRRGYDVTAAPVPEGDDEISHIFPVEKGIFSPYEGAEPIDVSANSGTQAALNIDDLMESWGDGARAIVCVQWRAGQGHAFIAERVDGQTRYVDPQTGNPQVRTHFILAKGSGAWCGRIDNLPFTERIHECCQVRKKEG